MARSILESSQTPLVVFEFQLDLIPEDHFEKEKKRRQWSADDKNYVKYQGTCNTLRADAIAFDPWSIKNGKGHIRILEIKSGRNDFTVDKKWERYLPYCTQFAFLAPDDAIKYDELPNGIGLFTPRLVQYRHMYDSADGSYKAGDVKMEKIEPVKAKEWRYRKEGITAERREVIKQRLVNRGIAEMAANHKRHERLYYDCDVDLLGALVRYE